jgi:hypothetical protein
VENSTTTESSPEFVAPDGTGAVARPGFLRRLRRSLLIGGAVLAVVLFVAASRYQPLSITPGMAGVKDRGSSTEVTVSLSTTLSNSGPFGVDVVALRPKVYADPPLVVTPLQPCFQYFKAQHWCPQDKKGYYTGDKFHPFVLTGGDTIPVIWRYSFSCRRYDAGKSYMSGPVEVRVQYRFGFFTHQVMLVLSGNETAPPGSTGPCTPAG